MSALMYIRVNLSDHHFTVISLQTCVLCLSCYYLYIVLSSYLYSYYVVYLDHHFSLISLQILKGHHGPDHMVVGFTTIYANQCLSSLILWIIISISERCAVLCDKFVCDLRQVVDFFRVLRILPPIKLTGTKKLKYRWKWC